MRTLQARTVTEVAVRGQEIQLLPDYILELEFFEQKQQIRRDICRRSTAMNNTCDLSVDKAFKHLFEVRRRSWGE